jgi:hypothetical protein
MSTATVKQTAEDCATIGTEPAFEVEQIDEYTERLHIAPDTIRRGGVPVALDLPDLLTATFPARRMLLAPWLQSQSLSMLYAWRGVGKTHVALAIAYAVASGGEFLGWTAPEPVPVLYLDGEMPGAALRERVARIVESVTTEPPEGYLRFVTPDCQPEGIMPDLATYEGQDAVERVLGNAQVIVIDNLSCLVRHAGKENDAESWLSVAEWGLRMRASGRSVLFVHHAGKGGQQRGTSKREDLLDASILLKRPSDYTPDQGARFEVHFEKARALFGQEVEPIEAALVTDPAGTQLWIMRPVAEAADRQMIELADLGLSQAEIARELGCHRSTVLRALNKAQLEGRYRPPTKGRRHA